MADIVTRLLLKTNDFDANLNKSKQSVNDFQGGITNMAKTAGAGIAKFAGAIGLAVGVSEGFMKTIRASQGTSDEFDNVMNSCKSSVDSFFSSLASGDFTTFSGGLKDIMERAYEASAALDQLGNTTMSYGYFGGRAQAVISENRAMALDKSLPIEKRNEALGNWRSAIDEKKEYSTTLRGDVLDALKKTVVEGTVFDSDKITLEDFEEILKLDLLNPGVRDREKSRLDNQHETYRVKMKALSNQKKGALTDALFPDYEGSKSRASHDGKIKERQEALNEEYKKTILYKKVLDKWTDEELQNAINLAGEYHKVNDEIAMQENTYNRARDRVGGEEKKKVGKDKKEEKPLDGSIAYFDAELSKANKKLTEATGAQARAAIQATIDELEKKKIELLVVEKGDSLDALSLRISKLKTEFATATTDEARKEIYKLIKELESKQLKINLTAKYDENKASLKNAGLPTTGLDTSKIKLPKHESLIGKKDIDLSNEYNESLYAMGSMLGSLSTAFDGNTGSVLQWGASLLGTIAQAIPAIIGMTAVKATDTVATNANTTAEVTNAGAKALSAHAGIPFVGIALGLAGVAAIAAAIASMPKFESGGIVGGNSFTGDSIIARVNSGEMILNQSQQANLFGMLNTRRERPTLGNMAQIVQPTEQKEVQISGSFKVKGSDLELALKNQTNKKSKIR